MAENKHTISDLYQMQALPLSAKIRMTQRRIYDWIDYYGENGVYISFSGGKDSTVLMDIVKNMGYKRIPAVFVDVPTQFPELKEFALTFDNVVVIKPKISFMQVCEKYGFPLVSKEVSECTMGAKKYLTSLMDRGIVARQTDRQTDRQTCRMLTGIAESEELASFINQEKHKANGSVRRFAIMAGMFTKQNQVMARQTIPSKDRSGFQLTRWQFLLDAPFEISNKCCKVMKKDPIHKYEKETGRNGITAQMASESKLRTQKWLQNGCNGFDLKKPISNPMSFWTEQDVLLYIKQNNLPICSVYGEVVEDYDETDDIEGQLTFSDLAGFENMELFDAKRPPLKTTGCKRTGCMLCGFGCHLEKSPNRFELLKQTHPKMYDLLDVIKNNGVTMREAIEWMNENGNLNIRL